MSTHIRRIRAMQALLAGSVLSVRSSYATIYNELSEVTLAGRIQRQGRKQLLQVLHSTRALDTSLQELLIHHGITIRRNSSLGTYLRAFVHHTVASLGQLHR